MKMAYRSRRRYGRRYRRYRSRAKPQQGVWGIAKKAAWNIAKYYLNPEKKVIDVAETQTTPGTSGTVVLLSGIAQGDDITNRNGRSIRCTSLLFRAAININASAVNTWVRYILFTDKATAGSAPAVTDVLKEAKITAPLNASNAPRFHIFRDRVYALDGVGLKNVHMEEFIKYREHIKYIGTDATITSAGVGTIYVLMLSSEAINTPMVSWSSRIRFLDN